MNMELPTRSTWPIDRLLESCLGAEIRILAKAFAPSPWNGRLPTGFRLVGDLYLPDNSQPGDLPVFFEGRLQCYERQIGVVFVGLESPSLPKRSPEGRVFLRGSSVVIIKGPAVVELAFPFQVERLHPDPSNYLRDRRHLGARFDPPSPGNAGNGETLPWDPE